jgi:hypothetical protein
MLRRKTFRDRCLDLRRARLFEHHTDSKAAQRESPVPSTRMTGLLPLE